MPRKKKDPATPANNAAAGVTIEGNAAPGVIDGGPPLSADELTAISAAVKRNKPTNADPGPAGFDAIYEKFGRAPMFGPFVDDDGTVYRLPALPGDRDNAIGAIADVFFNSGYFGELTPAQIAVQIMAGSALNMSPIESMFNLELGIDAGIRYTGNPTGRPPKFEDVRIQYENGRPDPVTPETASAAAEPNGNVRPFPGTAAAEPADLANKGDLSGRADERPLGPAQGPETTAATPKPASAAAVEDNPTAPTATGSENIDIARERIAFITKQFGGDAVAKVQEFEAMTTGEQAAMLEKAEQYYSEKLEDARAGVLVALAADGKSTIDQQRGFFLYAEVPGDPDEWTLTDARKANAAIADFIGSGPKPAA